MRYEIEGKLLSDIGDAIREKTGKSELILPGDMPGEIEGIKSRDGRLYLIDPDDIDAYASSNYQDGGFPAPCVMSRYASVPFFTVGTTTFDSITKNCVWRTNTDVCGAFICKKLPSNRYKKLFIKCKVQNATGNNYLCDIGFKTTCEFGNADGWISYTKRLILVDSSRTVEQINSQNGIVIHVNDNKNLPEQTVEIDIPANNDLYVGFINWWCNMYIREMYVE